MKRFLCSLLVVFCIVTLCSCAKKETIRQPVTFYYCAENINYNSATGVITPETRDGYGYDENLTSLINVYLQGPTHEGYYSPFPQNAKVLNISTDATDTTVMLSKDFSELSGYQLTLACACLSKTLMDLTGCSRVRIGAQDAVLDGNAYIQMTEETILLIDNYTTSEGA